MSKNVSLKNRMILQRNQESFSHRGKNDSRSPNQNETDDSKSELHKSRITSLTKFKNMEQEYRVEERSLKDLRLKIEVKKIETIAKMDSMNLKSPTNWTDKLIQYRIRRQILNREKSIEEFDKEEVYNKTHNSFLSISGKVKDRI